MRLINGEYIVLVINEDTVTDKAIITDKNSVLFPNVSTKLKITILLSIISALFIYAAIDTYLAYKHSYTGFQYTPTGIYYINKGAPCKLA